MLLLQTFISYVSLSTSLNSNAVSLTFCFDFIMNIVVEGSANYINAQIYVCSITQYPETRGLAHPVRLV